MSKYTAEEYADLIAGEEETIAFYEKLPGTKTDPLWQFHVRVAQIRASALRLASRATPEGIYGALIVVSGDQAESDMYATAILNHLHGE